MQTESDAKDNVVNERRKSRRKTSREMRHVFADWATNIIALFIACLGTFISAVMEGGAARDDHEAFRVWAIAGILVVAILVILYVVQVLATSSERRRFDAIRKEYSSAQSLIAQLQVSAQKTAENLAEANREVGRSVSETHKTYHAISALFAGLENSHSALDAAILDLIASICRGNKPDYQQIFKTDKALENLLLHICNTAVSVVAMRKGVRPETISANIKVITKLTGEARYSAIKRSSGGNTERDAADSILNLNPKVVMANFYYGRILDPSVGSPNYYLLRDINDLLPTIHHPLDEPDEAAARLYCSCLIVPIKGTATDVYADPRFKDHNTYLTFRDTEHVLGFMCIDSTNKGEFDAGYDLNIMNQLATQAFNAIRDYNCVIGMTKECSATIP